MSSDPDQRALAVRHTALAQLAANSAAIGDHPAAIAAQREAQQMRRFQPKGTP